MHTNRNHAHAASLTPIGTFHCDAKYAYDAARQPEVAHATTGHVVLEPGHNYEQAVQDLAGFSRIWLLFQFHHNQQWKPLVLPPRAERKVGVFATRAPYRPNGLGLSCVELLRVEGLRVDVAAHDLLDGTPIFDIKPYIPYADSFPDARCGWIDALRTETWAVMLSPEADAQVAWLETHGVPSLRAFIMQQLGENPLDTHRKRIRPLEGGHWEIAYRTWRIAYAADATASTIHIHAVRSGYSLDDLNSGDDKYADKETHRAFRARFRE